MGYQAVFPSCFNNIGIFGDLVDKAFEVFFSPAHLYAGSRDSLSIRKGRKKVVGEDVKRLCSWSYSALLLILISLDLGWI